MTVRSPSFAALLFLAGIIAGVSILAGSAAPPQPEASAPYDMVLGIAQDAGYPQAGCGKPCCEAVHAGEAERKFVSCLALVDPASGQRWLFDATPDFREQLRMLDDVAPARRGQSAPGLDGIFLTHAHIGHYTGLMFLGHESMGATDVPVYTMPRMRRFLTDAGPWSQLVGYKNIKIRMLQDGMPIRLNERLFVTPIRVPHREEFSEVVGFRIDGPDASVLFIPDIDKWEKWKQRVENVILTVDVAYLDGSFYSDDEIPGRDMSSFPHPFISETMTRFRMMQDDQRAKVRFIHLNHSNPALDPDGEAAAAIREAGMRVAEQGERVGL